MLQPNYVYGQKTTPEAVLEAMHKYKGNAYYAATELGISRERVRQIINKLGGREFLGLPPSYSFNRGRKPKIAPLAIQMLKDGVNPMDISVLLCCSKEYVQNLRSQEGLTPCIICKKPKGSSKRMICEECQISYPERRKQLHKEYSRAWVERNPEKYRSIQRAASKRWWAKKRAEK